MNSRIHHTHYREQLASADAAIGQNWPYGIHLVSGWPEDEDPESFPPRWRAVSPLGIDVYGFELTHSSETPPTVDIYTRTQYEIACRAAGIVAPADVALAEMVEPGAAFDWNDPATAGRTVAARLARRRLRGMAYEIRAGIRPEPVGVVRALIRRLLDGKRP